MKKMISANNLVKYFGEGDERVRVLDEVSIEGLKGEFICVMGPSSSGKSTLMLCRALMGAPDIIFGDEPTGALNSKTSQEIMNLFTEINAKGTTVMLVTHDAMVAARAERVLFMRDGKIINEACLGKYDAKCLNERIGRITEITCELGI